MEFMCAPIANAFFLLGVKMSHELALAERKTHIMHHNEIKIHLAIFNTELFILIEKRSLVK
jgi:hypothetical protein